MNSNSIDKLLVLRAYNLSEIKDKTLDWVIIIAERTVSIYR